MTGKQLPVLGIFIALLIAIVGWSRDDNRRRQTLSTAPAPWNAKCIAYDIPIDNNCTTIRRGFRATFVARPINQELAGAPVVVDRIIFGPEDKISEYTWRKSIGDISIPANESSTINAYVIDPRRAGTLLIGDLTIEFAA